MERFHETFGFKVAGAEDTLDAIVPQQAEKEKFEDGEASVEVGLIFNMSLRKLLSTSMHGPFFDLVSELR